MLKKGVDGNQFNFTFKERNNISMIQQIKNYCSNYIYLKFKFTVNDLGNTIIKIWETSPGGVLTFFSSYSFLNSTIESWKKSGIIKKMKEYKSIHCEPNTSQKCTRVIREYYMNAYRKGAILFAVCRGKISEGLDFSDDAARTVIQIGIPFPGSNYKEINYYSG